MADLSTLQGWLTEAETARHQLAMGQAVVEIARDGRKITYSSANAGTLDSYIAELTRLIAAQNDTANGTTLARRRSIGVMFGR